MELTPKEKAKELVDKFHYQICNDNGMSESDSTEFSAKQCSLIAVDELMLINPKVDERQFKNNCSWVEQKSNINYWLEVKQEINNL